jgi:hypothetical protein
MNTINFEDLINHTNDFFNKFWNIQNDTPPTWSDSWDFNSEIPNNRNRGCYAIFEGEELVYVGLAIGKGTERYENHGLGFRLQRFWNLNRDINKSMKYVPTKEWELVTAIHTIGFNEDDFYLAPSLELYLIDKLSPKKNRLFAKNQ